MYVPKPAAAEEEVRRVLTATGRRAATSDALGLTASSKQQRVECESEQSHREHGTNKAARREVSY